jgi:hypothetical protein
LFVNLTFSQIQYGCIVVVVVVGANVVVVVGAAVVVLVVDVVTIIEDVKSKLHCNSGNIPLITGGYNGPNNCS